MKPAQPSLVRTAWGLPVRGGLVVVPDEFKMLAEACGLRPAERLTLIALLRAWNPRKTKAPMVQMSLDDLCWWTGITKGQQSRIVCDLIAGWRPPLMKVFVPSARASACVYDLRGLVARTQRIAADGLRPCSDSLRLRNRRIAPPQLNGSATATHSRLNQPQTLDVREEEPNDGQDLTLLCDDALVAIVDSKDERYLHAVIERRRRGLTAKDEKA